MDGGVVGLVLSQMFTAVVIAMLVLAYLRRRRPRDIVRDEREGTPYRVYTRRFDVDADARDVPSTLHANPLLWARGWVLADPAIWHRKVAASRTVPVDRDGRLASRLTNVFVSTTPSDWAICFLVDHSGSMKEDPIRDAAAALRWCSTLLTEAGAKVAVLGFSTVGWHGGQAGFNGSPTAGPGDPAVSPPCCTSGIRCLASRSTTKNGR